MWILLVAVLVAAVSMLGAQEKATVGDLLVKIAEARKVDARTPAVASASLRADGFAVPARGLEDPLTEGLMVDVAGAFGVKVTTASPTALIDEAQVDSFMAAFSTELSGAIDPATGDAMDTDGIGNNGNGANPLEKGKGKKVGLRSPSDPA
jgi:hypothetical protein